MKKDHPEKNNLGPGKLGRIDKFFVPGIPVQKGRPRFFRMGKGVRAYTPEKTTNYQNLVKLSHQQAVGKMEPWDGPVATTIRAVFPITKSKPKWFKDACEKAQAEGWGIPVTKTPDLDNLVKAVLDALDGIAYTNDRQVFSLKAAKVYGTTPGAQVILYCYEGPTKGTAK